MNILVRANYILMVLIAIGGGVGCPSLQAQVTADLPSGWHTMKARVLECIDGDTILVRDGRGEVRHVRLLLIDTPETAKQRQRKFIPAQLYADEARDLLVRLLTSEATLHIVPSKYDNYGRLLALVYTDVHGEESVNEQLVEKGAAFVYPHSDTMKVLPDQLLDRFTRKQQQAIVLRAGLWKKLLASDLADKTYVGNRRSMRFHSDSCIRGRKTGRRNRIVFTSLEQAFAAGFAPARRCFHIPSR